ncbi:fumarylacetoacetate hydrolase family protein [Hoeflea poritis]|uniref:Fumarylacetoacetate hydrolase family protein n=1 Tax=Hoeflea poritis TaxID=2993659 RepID=A0ABT4VT00_9HYPH|nr:fumarylacetoacetate hydrolase family protein [Hoeflea poritis]MDA4847814.1 fumarylacetoacetate hydrolase family protein [Hoeflea poritis]
MKFGTIYEHGASVTILQGKDGKARRLADVASAAGVACPAGMLDLVTRSGTDGLLLAALTAAVDAVRGFETADLDWAPPLPNPSKILGVAFNNRELMKKAHRDPGVPNFFLKPPSALQGHGKPIVVDPQWGAVIPEPEVCAVIGRRAKRIGEAEALDYVFGYLIHNDVTSHGLKFQKDSIAVTYDPDMARPEFYGWRNRSGPDDTDAYYVYHTRSKGTDTFGPMGPWITTRDEVADPNDLTVVGTLDEEVFTRDHTGNYRFSVEACIAEASRYFTLEPGDLISFGTTGKGAGRFPRGHKSVLIGEEQGTIGIAIEPLGLLRNPIKHQKGGA